MSDTDRLAALLHAEFTKHEDEDGVPEPCALCDARAARLIAAGVTFSDSHAALVEAARDAVSFLHPADGGDKWQAERIAAYEALRAALDGEPT